MSRRRAREAALRVLYQRDVGGDDPRRALRLAVQDLNLAPEAAEFAWDLVMGTLDHLGPIDRDVAALSPEWAPRRMAAIDRNLLRLGVFELAYTDTPVEVVINEAVELAKRYSTGDSGRFINGVLGALARRLGRAAAAQKPAPGTEG
ncbi:MAG: transcription antitermination factor NusB [Acetobacteraceae bacterium]|nr:transcription antitermination factor NusB [Acetobacteraceae bacterium]